MGVLRSHGNMLIYGVSIRIQDLRLYWMKLAKLTGLFHITVDKAVEHIISFCKFIGSLMRMRETDRQRHSKRNCCFCDWKSIKEDESHRWLGHDDHCFVVLARDPKISGHILVASKRLLFDERKTSVSYSANQRCAGSRI